MSKWRAVQNKPSRLRVWAIRAFKAAIPFLYAALPILYISHLLERLSGTALWLPHAWRLSVLFISTVFGTLVFLWKKPAEVDSEPYSQAGQTEHQKRLQLAVWNMLGCIVMFGAFIFLREFCVYSWDARDWIKAERRNPDVVYRGPSISSVQPEEFYRPLRTVLLNLPNFLSIEEDPPAEIRNGSIFKQWWWERTGLGSKAEAENIKEAEILLPLWYPANERTQIKQVADEYHEDGVTHILNHEPDTIIDWGRNSWGIPLGITVFVFLLLDIAIIYFFAVAAGYSYERVDAILHLFGLT